MRILIHVTKVQISAFEFTTFASHSFSTLAMFFGVQPGLRLAPGHRDGRKPEYRFQEVVKDKGASLVPIC